MCLLELVEGNKGHGSYGEDEKDWSLRHEEKVPVRDFLNERDLSKGSGGGVHKRTL